MDTETTRMALPSVLVVDDQEVVRRFAHRALGAAGYRVYEAGDAEEALTVLSMPHARIDAVILDVVMPGTDGVALGVYIRKQWPSIKLLFMSAQSAEVLAQHGQRDLSVPFVAKPFTIEELSDKLAAALNAPSPAEPAAEPPITRTDPSRS